MPLSFFSRLFPPPRYLRRPAAGLDLSDRSIKFIDLDLKSTGLVVKNFGQTDLPVGVIENGEIKNQATLVSTLKNLAAEYHLEAVACDVPEEHAYVVKLKLPKVKPAQWSEMIEVELPEYIPLPPGAIIFDFTPGAIDETGKWQTIDVVAVAKRVIDRYVETLALSALTPVSFEVEAAALARAIVDPSIRQPVMIVDLGKVRASFSIILNGVVLDTATVVGLGGDDFTERLRKNLQLTFSEAETRKIESGLIRTAGKQEQFFALVPLVSALADEIKKRERFWREHGRLEKGSPPVARIILTGGQATLPGLAEYLEASVRLPVNLANPWINTLDLGRTIPPLPLAEASGYSAAIGLALRSFVDL